jgi:hypothetical protein
MYYLKVDFAHRTAPTPIQTLFAVTLLDWMEPKGVSSPTSLADFGTWWPNDRNFSDSRLLYYCRAADAIRPHCLQAFRALPFTEC